MCRAARGGEGRSGGAEARLLFGTEAPLVIGPQPHRQCVRQLRAPARVARPLAHPLAHPLAGAAQRACTAHAVSIHAPAVLARWAVVELLTQREDGAVWRARPLGWRRRLLLDLVRARARVKARARVGAEGRG